jgi:hypothetical protein
VHWIHKICRLHFQSRENRQCHVSVLAAPTRKSGSQNSSEQSCGCLLFHSISVPKILPTVKISQILTECQFTKLKAGVTKCYLRSLNCTMQARLARFELTFKTLKTSGFIVWKPIFCRKSSQDIQIRFQFIEHQKSVKKVKISKFDKLVDRFVEFFFFQTRSQGLHAENVPISQSKCA